MAPAIVIVADDLTGAADCGVACTAAGLDTVVVFSEVFDTWDWAADVIAVDADTRRAPAETAATVTGRIVRELCSGGAAYHRRSRISRDGPDDAGRVDVCPGRTDGGERCLAQGEAFRCSRHPGHAASVHRSTRRDGTTRRCPCRRAISDGLPPDR